MPRIATIRSKGPSNEDVISLVLSQDAVSAGPDGDPWCGLTLNAVQARSLAQRLCDIKEIIAEFQRSTGHAVKLTLGSSGKFSKASHQWRSADEYQREE